MLRGARFYPFMRYELLGIVAFRGVYDEEVLEEIFGFGRDGAPVIFVILDFTVLDFIEHHFLGVVFIKWCVAYKEDKHYYSNRPEIYGEIIS